MRVVVLVLGSALLATAAMKHGARWLFGDLMRQAADIASDQPGRLADRPTFRP